MQVMFSENKQTICVNGLGGIGKSELVRKYTELHKKDFSYLIWINAETAEDIRRCFHKLAIELEIPVVTEGAERELSCIIDNIYEYLSMEKSLIIFDNVLSRRDIKSFLPTNDVNVIITSQNKQWGTIPVVNLGVLSMEEAIEFIRNSLTEYHLQEEDINDIMNLAIATQYLPLALQQAVSYIQYQNCNNEDNVIFTTKEYLKKFNEEEEILDAQFPVNSGYPFPDFSDNDYSKTIFLTLKLALAKVDQGGVRGKLSMEVLNILAYLSPDHIHKSLILEAIEDKNEETLKSILLTLVTFSLVDINDEYINIHRLVQKVLRSQQTINDKPYFLKRSIDVALSDLSSVDSLHNTTVLKHAEHFENFLIGYYENVTESIKSKLFLSLVYNGGLNTITNILKTSTNIVHCSDTSLKSPLHYSCIQGHEHITKLLIDTGASITKSDIDGFLPIHNACLRGHIKLLNFLIDNKTNFNIGSHNGLTPLHQAVKGGHINILKYLISKGADVSCKTKNNFTALHLAASEGYSDIVKLLVEVIDINAANIDNITPLHEATFGGHKNIVCDLIRLGADKNIRSVDGYTPIFGAVAGGHPELLEILIDEEITRNNQGALPLHVAAQAGLNEMCEILLRYSNVDDLTFDGYTPIYFAAAAGHTHTVKLLIDHKANFTNEYPDGKTIMYIACQKGNATLLKLLLEQNVDVDYRNAFGETAIFAAATSNHLNCLKMLIGKNANVDLESKDGTTPLLKAVSRGYLRIVSLLVDNNAFVNAENQAGMSVLLAACSKGFLQITKLLRGATINHVTKLGLTALYVAATKGHTSIVQLLFSRGADANLNCKGEISPLHGAARPGHLKTVEILLQNGANLTISDEGMTPLMEASLGGHVEVFQLLVNNGAVVEHVNKAGKSALHMSAEVGCYELVRIILDMDMDVNLKTITGLTPLHMSSFKGHLSVVGLLLEKGAWVNIENAMSYTPLHGATAGKHVDVMAYLIANNADVNAVSKDGIFPLLMATTLGCTEAVQLLIDKDADYRKIVDGNTLLHVAVQGNHYAIIELLLEKGLSID